MDAIAYSLADKQAKRIEKLVAEPDSAAGLVSVPNLVPTGETITIPTGRTVVHPSLQVDGTLDVQGTLFIPSGGSVSTTEVDATVVKQDGNVVANDSTVVHKTGNETIAGIKTFSGNTILNGNVGIGANAPSNKLDVVGAGVFSGTRVDSGNAGVVIDWASTFGRVIARTANMSNYANLQICATDTLFVNGGYERAKIDAGGNFLLTGGIGGLGYGTGSGGTVTQVGSMYDPVLLNKPSGKIFTFSQQLPAGAVITFNLYNTTVLSIDTIVSTLAGNFSTKYELNTYIQSDGFVVFSIKNKTGEALTESRTINFAIIKGAIA